VLDRYLKETLLCLGDISDLATYAELDAVVSRVFRQRWRFRVEIRVEG
jgi:hypothetical protein